MSLLPRAALSSSFSSLARIRGFGLCAALLTSLALGGCAAEAAPEDNQASSEAALAASHRIVATPKVGDVVDAYLKLANASFDKARAQSPATTKLTEENLEAFCGDERNLEIAFGTFLESKPSREVSVEKAMAEFGAFWSTTLKKAAGADGLVGESLSETPRGSSSST